MRTKCATGERIALHPRSFVFSLEDARSPAIRQAHTGEESERAYMSERLGQGVLFSDQPEETHLKQLMTLERKKRESLEEGGAHTIYLALGLLQWFESSSSEVARFAPLLLLPVVLRRGTARAPWTLAFGDQAPVFNPSLIQRLQADLGLDLTELAEELPGDDAEVDVAGIFTRVRSAIRGIPRWELREEAHLAQLSFTKLVM